VPQDLTGEYRARIHQAQDYIEANLGGELTLEAIAKAACFSSFHFHRLFAVFAGETLYQYILRQRLERAASLLVSDGQRNVTEIALDCGFSSSAVFARCFRKAFSMSATEYGKKCKVLSKEGKAPGEVMGYLKGTITPFSRRMPMTSLQPIKSEIREYPERTLAYLRHVGPYAGDSALFERLWGKMQAWAGSQGLIGPKTEMLCMYHDDPSVTEPAKLRISLGVTVPPQTRVSGDITLMQIPASRVACMRYEIAAHQYADAWAGACQWMAQNGLECADQPCYEASLNDPNQHPQKMHIFEICIPVRQV
jgi:AraC family transcriptional regulator